MAQFRITGEVSLRGEIKVAGNKNSVLPLMAAALVVNDPVTLTNVPKIRDVERMGEIIQGLGAKVEGIGTDELRIDASTLTSWEPNPTLSAHLRGSILLAAPLLARFGKVRLSSPGGDSIGERLLDTHFELLSKMGVKISTVDGAYELTGKAEPAQIFLDEASVTATEIGLILAAGTDGTTVIEDAAGEPHVQDVARFLSNAGARISGEGTNLLTIEGTKSLRGVEHRVSNDYIEVGTFAIATAITHGETKIIGAQERDLKIIFSFLSRMGVDFRLNGEVLEVRPSDLKATRKTFKTRPWPGFPTDLMSAFIVLSTQTDGRVVCHDWMYEWRIFFVDHLIKMGADITIADPHRILVAGPTKLRGEVIPSNDIRAGSALLLAALVARGESIIEHAEIIDRGFEDLDGRLLALGAKIERVE